MAAWRPRSPLCSILLCLSFATGVAAASFMPQPNPPAWPSSVRVFGPADDPAQILATVRGAFSSNGGPQPSDHGQFSPSRFAFLFRPGTYHVDVPVGYYTQVLGLGSSPQDVVFDSPRGVYSEEGDQSDMGGALSTFWRGAENFRNRANMLWAVSQAAPLRRIIADKDLSLAQYVDGVGMGYSSGGFVGNVQVGGTVQAGSQQQFCTRNVGLAKGVQGGVWNMVFIGSPGAPPSHCGQSPGHAGTVTVGAAPVIAEKPFISMDVAGKYFLQVPPIQRDRIGPDFGLGRSIDFSQVYVAQPQDAAAVINERLATGLHVILSPGIYHLDAPLQLSRHDQVLLGLGLATLVSARGNAVIQVGNVDGVRIAGVLLQAGQQETAALLEWGDGRYLGNPQNPGFLHDVFARVGGPNDPAVAEVHAEVMVRIRSGNVVGDNLWLWRADHGVAGLVRGGANPCKNGLVVTGDDVTMYGLAVEHTLGDLVQWSGNRGRTYFYQSELPYDVTQAYGNAGYVGYRVNETVEAHTAVGTGVYHFFRDYEVTVQRGIAAPAWLANSFESPLSVYLTGRGRVLHVLNDRGSPTHDGLQAEWSCDKGPAVPYVPVPSAQPVAALTTSRIPEQEAPTTAPPATRTDIAVVLAALPADQEASGGKSVESDRTEVASASAQGSTAAGESAQARPLVPWWAYLMGLQSLLLIGFGYYSLRSRWQAKGQPSSPTAQGRSNTLVRAHLPEGSTKALPGFSSLRLAAQSPVRLRGLAALSRTFTLSHAASPLTARSDTARSVAVSPAESAFGARSPHWRPEEGA